jgi:D-alanyl-D-alanine carboxypeptidase
MTLWMELLVVLQMIVGLPLDTLVDSEHGLSRWYDPGADVRMEAAAAEMISAASLDGISIAVFSDYRPYSHQSASFQREVSEIGELAGRTLAHPGSSEHQLGTAIDVVWPGLHVESRDPRNFLVYEWIEAHAHSYGFVISYPFKTVEGWPYDNKIYPLETDFIHEPWHLRFVGLELAEAMHEAGYLDPDSDVLPKDFYQAWP